MLVRKRVIAYAFLSAPALCLAGQTQPLMSDIRLRGYAGERLDDCLCRNLKAMDLRYLTDPFLRKSEAWGWDTEFWGKFMQAAVPLSEYAGDADFTARIAAGTKAVVATQLPNGYIGNFREHLRGNLGWDVWGNKYTMLGLLEYHAATGDESARTSACRLADYLIGQFPAKRALHDTGGYRGLASCSLLEPIVRLYKLTKERRYLDFAAYIVSEMNGPKDGVRLIDAALEGISVGDRKTGEPFWKNGGLKAYEMMSCYQGLLEYYEVTGEERILRAAVMTAEDIAATEVNVCGGLSCREQWYHGARQQTKDYNNQQETCVQTTWMRLCEKLFVVTGDPRWADRIERTFFNAYLAALSKDGSVFTTYTPLAGVRRRGQDHCGMTHNCCNANGPRGFLPYLGTLVTAEEREVRVNQYAASTVSVPVPGLGGERVRLEIYTRYPRLETVSIRYDGDRPQSFALKLRIPSWADGTRARLVPVAEDNTPGRAAPAPALDKAVAGSYLTVSRLWTPGDAVELTFDLSVRKHVQDGFVAFTRGPVTLSRDLRFRDGDLGEPLAYGGDSLRPDAFCAVESPIRDMWITCSARLDLGSHRVPSLLPREVKFCDYASAGNTWDLTSASRVWIPVSREFSEIR